MCNVEGLIRVIKLILDHVFRVDLKSVHMSHYFLHNFKKLTGKLYLYTCKAECSVHRIRPYQDQLFLLWMILGVNCVIFISIMLSYGISVMMYNSSTLK